MRASKFSEAQKAYVVKRGEEGVPVAKLCREAGISQATYFNWRKSEPLSTSLVQGQWRAQACCLRR